MKRSASSLSPRLTSSTSTLNASITLFKFEEPDAGPLEDNPVLRRSKRVKLSADNDMLLKTETKEVLTEEREQKKVRTTGKAKEKRVASPRKPKAIPQSLEKPHPAPLHWKEVYDAIKEMRAKIVAPVDTMGEAVGGSLNVDALLATDESAISEAINKVGFWRRKTQ
ncbi:hypothetical protein EWM64_g5254 [Hericium alpestre]|uniref:Uncharacterized protein n=1 Tax=Hericium alpestre TaxID=135208 RepID=A0A4Y9ZZA7_9AGAM|nr:hypothetical protein EWM64_g5254 [Hericium alpestre]